MDKLYIVMPAYNEEANIEKTIEEWYPVISKIGMLLSLSLWMTGVKILLMKR